jgi:hypothetical protein
MEQNFSQLGHSVYKVLRKLNSTTALKDLLPKPKDQLQFFSDNSIFLWNSFLRSLSVDDVSFVINVIEKLINSKIEDIGMILSYAYDINSLERKVDLNEDERNFFIGLLN